MQNLVFFYFELVLTCKGSVSRGGARPGRGVGARSRGMDGGTSAYGELGRRGACVAPATTNGGAGHGRRRTREWGGREREREGGKFEEGEWEGARPFIERGEER
jgi:hypothetical protein